MGITKRTNLVTHKLNQTTTHQPLICFVIHELPALDDGFNLRRIVNVEFPIYPGLHTSGDAALPGVNPAVQEGLFVGVENSFKILPFCISDRVWQVVTSQILGYGLSPPGLLLRQVTCVCCLIKLCGFRC